MIKKIILSGTAAADGSLTITSDELNFNKLGGYVEKVVYDYDNGDTGADLVLTCEDDVSETILAKNDLGVADTVFYPRTLTHITTTGANSTTIYSNKVLAKGTLKAVITNGGNATRFKFIVYLMCIKEATNFWTPVIEN